VHSFDAVVLAGGSARRLGGTDKPGLRIGGRTLLDGVLAAASGAGLTVVAGPPRAARPGAVFVREDPPGGGPVAGLAAALPRVTAPLVVLLAADLPFVTREVVEALVAAVVATAGESDGALIVDADGRDQYLLAAYRTNLLAARLADLGDPHGAPLRALVGGLRLVRMPDPAGVAFDCDTWADVDLAQTRLSGRGRDRAGDSGA
jgi:molybdopterin-guanine dinucleotide biosynthesis protein A